MTNCRVMTEQQAGSPDRQVSDTGGRWSRQVVWVVDDIGKTQRNSQGRAGQGSSPATTVLVSAALEDNEAGSSSRAKCPTLTFLLLCGSPEPPMLLAWSAFPSCLPAVLLGGCCCGKERKSLHIKMQFLFLSLSDSGGTIKRKLAAEQECKGEKRLSPLHLLHFTLPVVKCKGERLWVRFGGLRCKVEEGWGFGGVTCRQGWQAVRAEAQAQVK